MAGVTMPTKKATPLTAMQLKMQREKIYRQKVPGYSLIPAANGKELSAANEAVRQTNFLKFIDLYFIKDIVNDNLDPWSGNYQKQTRLMPSSDGYKAFSRFADTGFGSALIKEMLNDPKKYAGFSVGENTSNAARGWYNGFSLPKRFPDTPVFKTSGQKIYDLAIIWHEFAHTLVFLPPSAEKKDVSPYDERDDVRQYENPVRISAGYEPRYTYTMTDESKTINIITGAIAVGRWTVDKRDPMTLVSLSSPDALK
jgi:hypothetical protein